MKMTLVGLGVIGILFSPVSFGICLGILEDKSWCEYKKKKDEDGRLCYKLADRQCEKRHDSDNTSYPHVISDSYGFCMDSVRRSCYKRLGYDGSLPDDNWFPE